MQGRSRSFLVEIAIVLFLIGNWACASAKERIYGGRVIDYETKEPIEGAVVVTIWHERVAAVAGGLTRLKDIKETLTNKNGEWSMTGLEEEQGSAYYSFHTGTYLTQFPLFIIYKPGYCPWPNGFSINACREKLKPGETMKMLEGEPVELPKLSNRDDRRRAWSIGPIHGDRWMGEKEILGRQKEFIRLLKEEEKYLFPARERGGTK